ncbi:anthranilate phosphoribosyltransferase [Listeria fleischmannii 1991]|uniref:Anthranilate phosphoribosyltransferase n=2 Tax=Listeria fleischmannii TaxID=1069827 RepID=A0A2X3GZ38_9LIST|nr:anthranilate phosphoribosyltransferase [Listeria fleischmannii]EMG28966.1 anthranilate phosphoribosyltransferase [Listeria fleischmannii subsp. fleischmannii LU2006-1]KMT60760.1 anthranilate phosphoribosyltransferase [Listeria fleischmannii 1991]SQC65347.1 Anthranilate phosphoribosyltransferase 2 [Listeria fleischmannii subsp. fleischmannii]
MGQEIQKLFMKQNLSEMEMTMIANQMFCGELSEIEITAILMALKLKGETLEEMSALARIMQNVALKIPYDKTDAMDNCGTGGDKSNTFNISTTSAFVLAAGGIKMAKHGNRSVSSRSGSADVCRELGIEMTLRPDEMAYLLENVGIAFLFAPHVHPNMKYVMNVRKTLQTPTIFNLIGPMTNPLPLKAQLMGIYRRDLLQETARALGKLGRERAVVVNGAGYMDEATLLGENHIALYAEGEVKELTFSPEDVGLKRTSKEKIQGGNARENSLILKRVLNNEKGAYLDTVLLNAGLGFFAYGKVSTIEEGVLMARKIVASGEAKQKLAELLAAQQEVLVG